MAVTKVTEILCCPPLGEGPLDEDDAAELAARLKALADPIRLRLVSMLTGGERTEICACDLPELLGRSQPTISHHLKQLVDAGLLDREQRGKWAWFSLRPGAMDAVVSALGGVTPEAADNGRSPAQSV
ncbi:MAG: metalloregulator ArsR/SmtB family transcription factor [Actinomycetota bacterium]